MAGGQKPKRNNEQAGRFSTPEPVRRLVWVRAAGHCEQCGVDVTRDFRTGKTFNWAEVAHVLPASPQGPRASAGYDEGAAERHTVDPDNLMLLCPSCHARTDLDADGYPTHDLSRHHRDHIDQIRHAASRGETQRASGLVILGGHFATENIVRARDLADAMLSESLWADEDIQILRLRAPGLDGRDEVYWRAIEQDIDKSLQDRLTKRTNALGDPLNLAVVGLADIPTLIRVGRQLGDRSNRFLFSRDRSGTLRWIDPAAPAPEWTYVGPPPGDGPIALVLALSAALADAAILDALPGARIARFTLPTPEYGLIRNRATIDSFRRALQPHLSQLEASTPDPLHLFAAIPAAIALEFGALLSTNHAHQYVIYDREGGSNPFAKMMELGPRQPSPTAIEQ
ncbi:HNH endonuclease [Dokdonella immobilis]|uniref:HNH endonuclease n=1 Tax=Dokdonella immobilis TaxID=578942 RepID=A0A1I4ZSC4_9GAMM|nr:HNH endonuclease [Dokdonella immobilis]